MQTADFYSSATGTLRVNGGRDENAPQGVSLSIDDLSYIKQGSRANDAEPVTDYDLLDNKPQINNITLTGNKSLNDLGIQPKIDSSHKVSADNVDDTDATNKFATAAQLAQITTNQNNISKVLPYPDDISSESQVDDLPMGTLCVSPSVSVAGYSSGSWLIIHTYDMNATKSRRMQVIESADGTRKTRFKGAGGWGNWT